MKIIRNKMYHVNFKSKLLDIERICRTHGKKAKIYYKIKEAGSIGYNATIILDNFIVYGDALEYRTGDEWQQIALDNINWVYMEV